MTEFASAEPPKVQPPHLALVPSEQERLERGQKSRERDRLRKRDLQRKYRAKGREVRRPRAVAVGTVDSLPVVEWVMGLIHRESLVLGFTTGRATGIVCERLGIPERTLFRWRMEGAKIQLDKLDLMLTRSEYLWWDVYLPAHGEAYVRVREFFEGA